MGAQWGAPDVMGEAHHGAWGRTPPQPPELPGVRAGSLSALRPRLSLYSGDRGACDSRGSVRTK